MRVHTTLVNRGNETNIFFLQLKILFLKMYFWVLMFVVLNLTF